MCGYSSKKNILRIYFGVIFCFTQCTLIGTGDFRDNNANATRPIVALADDDVTFPCHLGAERSVDAETITVEWSRPDMDIVHLHRDGREMYTYKHPYFRGRTALFLEEVGQGNISLQLSRVRLSDKGEYKCHVPKGKTSESEPDFEVVHKLIVGVVTQPVVSIMEIQDEVVVLQCASGSWYPEPTVEWLDSEGHVLSAGPTETLKDPDGTYTVRRNVTVENTALNKFTCRVQQQNISQTREVEFPVLGSRDCGPGRDRFVVLIPVVILTALVFVLLYVVIKQHRDIKASKNSDALHEPSASELLPTAPSGPDSPCASPKLRSAPGLNDSGYGSPGFSA